MYRRFLKVPGELEQDMPSSTRWNSKKVSDYLIGACWLANSCEPWPARHLDMCVGLIHQKPCWWSLDALIGTKTAEIIHFLFILLRRGEECYTTNISKMARRTQMQLMLRSSWTSFFEIVLFEEEEKRRRRMFALITVLDSKYVSFVMRVFCSLWRRRQPVERNGRKSLSQPTTAPSSPSLQFFGWKWIFPIWYAVYTVTYRGVGSHRIQYTAWRIMS
jgi:hypothetical protein